MVACYSSNLHATIYGGVVYYLRMRAMRRAYLLRARTRALYVTSEKAMGKRLLGVIVLFTVLFWKASGDGEETKKARLEVCVGSAVCGAACG